MASTNPCPSTVFDSVINRAHLLPIINVKLISSRDNIFFKQLAKLAGSARQRAASGLTLLDGPHLIHAYQLTVGQPKNLIVSESSCQKEEIKHLLAEQMAEGVEKETVIVLSDTLFRAVSPASTRLPSARSRRWCGS